MKYYLSLILISLSFCSYAQKNSRKIKKAKLTILNDEKFPFDIDRIKEGETKIPGGGIYKTYLVSGAINVIEIDWADSKSSSNPLANFVEVNHYYYVSRGANSHQYYQFFIYQGNKKEIQNISRANLIAAFGNEYENQIKMMKKVKLKAVKDLAEEYNKTHPLAVN